MKQNVKIEITYESPPNEVREALKRILAEKISGSPERDCRLNIPTAQGEITYD